MKPLTDKQREAATRELCRLRGEELIPANIIWARTQIREAEQIQTAIEYGRALEGDNPFCPEDGMTITPLDKP